VITALLVISFALCWVSILFVPEDNEILLMLLFLASQSCFWSAVALKIGGAE
jgi:hypothetical protein